MTDVSRDLGEKDLSNSAQRSAFPAVVQISYVGIIKSDLIVIPEPFPQMGKSIALCTPANIKKSKA